MKSPDKIIVVDRFPCRINCSPCWLALARKRPPLYDPYFLTPVLDKFVRALPYTFRDSKAHVETSVRLEITGEAGGVWFVYRTEEA